LSTNPLRLPEPSGPFEAPPENDNRALPSAPLSPKSAIAARFRHLAVWLILASGIIAISLTIALSVNVTARDTFVIDWVLAALLLASRIWWDRSGHHRLADAAGTVAVASLGAMTCGAIAMLELRLHFPIADGILHRADLALGLDGVQVVTFIARHRDPLLPILAFVYENTLQLFFASLILLSLTKDRAEAWRATFIFVGTLLTTCGVAAFIPATGLINWAPASALTFLPSAFLSHFREFYYGVHPLLRLQVIDGVITFPSFHAVVGFLVFSMWRKRVVTRVAAAIWLAVELLSTVAGGHYVIDLIGGFAVWAAWFTWSLRIERRAINPRRMLRILPV
jgi:PAP2 superfamily